MRSATETIRDLALFLPRASVRNKASNFELSDRFGRTLRAFLFEPGLFEQGIVINNGSDPARQVSRSDLLGNHGHVL